VVAGALAGVPALVGGERDFGADVAVMRATLEAEADRVAGAAAAVPGVRTLADALRGGER
jgi:hypothetical protein